MGGSPNPVEWCDLVKNGECNSRGATVVKITGTSNGMENGMGMSAIPNNEDNVTFEISKKNTGKVGYLVCKGGVSELTVNGSVVRFNSPSISGYNRCSFVIGISGNQLHVAPFGSINVSLGSLPITPGYSFNQIYCPNHVVKYAAIVDGFNPSPQVISTPVSQGVTNVDSSQSLPTTTTTTTSTTTTTTTTTTTAPPKLILDSNKYEIVPSIQNISGSLSFSINKSLLSNTELVVTLIDIYSNVISELYLKSCCLVLYSGTRKQFDRRTYTNEMKTMNSFNMSLAWTANFIYLLLTTSLTILAMIPRFENTNVPLGASLKTASGTDLITTWNYSPEFNPPQMMTCNLSSFYESCKSTSVSITSSTSWKQNTSFLRYGFISPLSSNYPIYISLTYEGTLVASVLFTQYGITVSSSATTKTISMDYSNAPQTGEWISGDIFILSPEYTEAVNTLENSTPCTLVRQNCASISDTWSSKKESDLLSIYGYISKMVVVSGVEETNSQSTLYLTYAGTIVGGISISKSSLDGASVLDSPTFQPLVYWKLYQGMSPSVNVTSDIIDEIKDNILNPTTTTTTTTTKDPTSSTSGSWLSSFLSWF